MTPDFDLLPNFFILGALRAGTASLHHYLRQHPAIFLTDPRDPRFFDKEEVYALGTEGYQNSFFGAARGRAWRGEASPTYFARPTLVGPRLRALYANRPLKFVVVLRDPIARAWSHYQYRVSHGYETGDFATALGQDRSDLALRAYYIDSGRYYGLLQQWRHEYPAGEFLFLLHEDLWHNPAAEVRRICAWLEIDEGIEFEVSARLNQATRSRSPRVVSFFNRPPHWVRAVAKLLLPYAWMRNDLRRRLRDRVQRPIAATNRPPLDTSLAATLQTIYADDVAALSRYLERDLSHWLQIADDASPAHTPRSSSAGR